MARVRVEVRVSARVGVIVVRVRARVMVGVIVVRVRVTVRVILGKNFLSHGLRIYHADIEFDSESESALCFPIGCFVFALQPKTYQVCH